MVFENSKRLCARLPRVPYLLVHRIGLLPHFSELSLNRTKGADGGADAAVADNYQEPSESGGCTSEDERPKLDTPCMLLIRLCSGGLFFAFGPGMGFSDKWGHLRAYLGIWACEAWDFLGILGNPHPHTWGLPPGWIPRRWQERDHHACQRQESHGVDVSRRKFRGYSS